MALGKNAACFIHFAERESQFLRLAVNNFSTPKGFNERPTLAGGKPGFSRVFGTCSALFLR